MDEATPLYVFAGALRKEDYVVLLVEWVYIDYSGLGGLLAPLLEDTFFNYSNWYMKRYWCFSQLLQHTTCPHYYYLPHGQVVCAHQWMSESTSVVEGEPKSQVQEGNDMVR